MTALSSSAAAPRQPHPTEDFGWALGVLLREYRDRVAPILADFPQGERGYQTLSEVVVHGDQPSQLALANRLGIDRTVMTYLVDDLEDAGLVARRANPEDRRQRRIVPTGQGHDTLAELCVRVVGAEALTLASLTPDERVVFRRLLIKAASGGDPSLDPCEVADELAPR
ncbi:MarR family transcriptional regulator [Microbacterium sp. BWT-B31]|uniref:MarR family winged helix-turn-helix transcriptional regulator n=1 Tax=Microbacterium sp. BWT-B31 TaxID=3232072 RepID=UPI00352926AA